MDCCIKVKKLKKVIVLFFVVLNSSFAQKNDTIIITPKNIKVSNLKEGKSSYLVYFKKGLDAPISDIQIWNIETKRDSYFDKRVYTIEQKWYFKDTIFHTAKSVSSTDDFKPLYHESWWNKRGRQVFDINKNKLWIDDIEITSTQTNDKKKATYDSFMSIENNFFVNWHLDLEVFSMLPYKRNTTFLIPFYEFGYGTPKNIVYKVAGEDELLYDGNKIKCWLLKLEEEGNIETYWISKKTKEVLKLEQVVQGKMYRYKIKLQ